MNRRSTGSPLILAMTLLVAACDSPQSSVAPPVRQEFIRFEYQIMPMQSFDVMEFSEQLQNGEMLIEEADLGDAADDWCRYEALFNPSSAQRDPDLRPDEQTLAPVLNAFGNPRSMGFNFIVSAFLTRNKEPTCGSLQDTIQGLEFTSSQGSASGTWRPGDEVRAITRPTMGESWLGPGDEFRNELNGQRLFFDHAVDSISRHGYVEGRFTFLAVAESGDRVILVRNGEFGMQNQR